MSTYWMRVRDGLPRTPDEERRLGRQCPYGRMFHAFDNDRGMGQPACGLRGVWGDQRLGGSGEECAGCARARR